MRQTDIIIGNNRENNSFPQYSKLIGQITKVKICYSIDFKFYIEKIKILGIYRKKNQLKRDYNLVVVVVVVVAYIQTNIKRI